MRDRIIQYVKAGFPGLYVQSSEEQRVEAEFKSIAESLKFGLHLWSATIGLMDVQKQSVRPVNDPLEALLTIAELPEESIVLLRDFHLFLTGDPNPVLVDQLKDVPTQAERRTIWEIQIAKYHRDPRDFDLVQLAKATDGLTGSEIEAVFTEALHDAFDAGSEPTDLSVASVLTTFVPLSEMMKEQLSSLRAWAKNRARPATSTISEQKLRRIAA